MCSKTKTLEYNESTCLLREIARSITTIWNLKQYKRCVPKQKLLNTLKHDSNGTCQTKLTTFSKTKTGIHQSN